MIVHISFGVLLKDEKEQVVRLSDPVNRLRVDRSPRADAVSAAAKVRRMIPR